MIATPELKIPRMINTPPNTLEGIFLMCRKKRYNGAYGQGIERVDEGIL